MANINDFKDGYAAAVEALKKQLQNNQNGQNNSQSSGNKSDLNNPNSQSKNSQGQGSGNGSDNLTADDAQNSAGEAKAAADKAQQNADSGKGTQADANAAKAAANDAKTAADKARAAADAGDKEAEAKAAQDAKDAADKAKAAAGEGQSGEGMKSAADAVREKDEKDGKSGESNKSGEGSDGDGDADGDGDNASDNSKSGGQSKKGGKGTADLGSGIDWKAKGDKIIEKYKNTLSGPLGNFVKQCKSSVKVEKNGLAVENNNRGSATWNEKLAANINGFIKKKLFQKRRRYESTYSRLKRGSGYVEYGKPINPGKRIKENKFPLNVAFYIDRSGSMSGCLDKVFSAAKAIGDALTKHFRKDPLIDKTEYRQWVFDDYIKELPWGKTCQPAGGTMAFERLLKEVEKNSKTYLVNVIITDAGFSGININDVKQFLENMEGMIYFVCNPGSPEIEALSKETKYRTKLVYILADNNFEISK